MQVNFWGWHLHSAGRGADPQRVLEQQRPDAASLVGKACSPSRVDMAGASFSSQEMVNTVWGCAQAQPLLVAGLSRLTAVVYRPLRQFKRCCDSTCHKWLAPLVRTWILRWCSAMRNSWSPSGRQPSSKPVFPSGGKPFQKNHERQQETSRDHEMLKFWLWRCAVYLLGLPHWLTKVSGIQEIWPTQYRQSLERLAWAAGTGRHLLNLLGRTWKDSTSGWTVVTVALFRLRRWAGLGTFSPDERETCSCHWQRVFGKDRPHESTGQSSFDMLWWSLMILWDAWILLTVQSVSKAQPNPQGSVCCALLCLAVPCCAWPQDLANTAWSYAALEIQADNLGVSEGQMSHASDINRKWPSSDLGPGCNLDPGHRAARAGCLLIRD